MFQERKTLLQAGRVIGFSGGYVIFTAVVYYGLLFSEIVLSPNHLGMVVVITLLVTFFGKSLRFMLQ